MRQARVALASALLCSLLGAGAALGQQRDDDIVPALRSAVASYRAGDLASAEAQLRRLAPASPDAEAWLGAVLIDRGQSREALQDLQHAMTAGSSEAALQLGVVYAQGLAGQPRDEARAADLFEKAANAGNRRAALNLGILYFNGKGRPRDLIQARAWLEKGAAGNNPYALYALARAMETSEGQAAVDPVRAADLYRRAAEQGHPLAALRYGLALVEGYGVKRDPVAAQRWLLAAKDAGIPEAALAIADMVSRSPATRDKAANEKNMQLAVAWYSAAADAGVPSAQFKLGNAFVAGTGVARDPAQAQLWYGRAARQGLPEAELALGLLLISGVAGSSDQIEGYKWLLLAERTGLPEAVAAREKMSLGMAEADRQKAAALAASFTPQPERPFDDTPPLTPLQQPPSRP